ncbi:MAG: hypothetical protein B5M54_07815 [Candidatus Aminicenantes bacterium 4484_214]|nr:MAG: hypothetical protein B5M54_07815 [Candidatus Aminicenantes bacterium 4484_214]
MSLSKEQETLYRKILEEAKEQLEKIDEEIEQEIQKTREVLARLQESKKGFQQVYEGAAKILGIPVEIEEVSEAKASPQGKDSAVKKNQGNPKNNQKSS